VSRSRRWLPLALLVAVAAGMLAAVDAAHPELRLVDFVPFAVRARALLHGQELCSPRYPVGYPALLAATKLALGSVLPAGRLLALLAGVLAVGAAGRWLGPTAGLWLLVQLPLLRWGSTEGTDLPAVALGLAALAVAVPSPGPRPAGAPTKGAASRMWVAGLLAGGAAMMRYPAVVVIPVVLAAAAWSQGRRGLLRASMGVLLVTAPHWGPALVGAGSLLPDTSENAAIGAGGLPGGPGAGWLPAVARALGLSLSTWPAWLGALGLGVGLLRRDGRALALLAWAALHLCLLGFFFSNERLVLPSTLALSLGVSFLLPAPLQLVVAASVLSFTWPAARVPDAAAAPREAMVARLSTKPGPVATTSPWLYLRRPDGWLEEPILVKQAVPAGAQPGGLTPPALVGWAHAAGIRLVVVDAGRVSATWPGLAPLLSGATPGLVEVARSPGWRAYRVQAP